jgi:hypothetical protein
MRQPKHIVQPKSVVGTPAGCREALLVARVSYKEQEQGFYLPAQTKVLRAYEPIKTVCAGSSMSGCGSL